MYQKLLNPAEFWYIYMYDIPEENECIVRKFIENNNEFLRG
jgi:hypothetical protein